MTYGEVPFGARDCKVYKLTNGTPGAAIDVPRIRRIELNVVRDSTTLEGDDVTVAVQSFAKRMEGSIEYGGINPAALAVLEGGTSSTTNSGMANEYITYAVRGTDVDSYFQIKAQAIGNDGGDVHLVVYKVATTSGPSITLENGAFTIQSCDIQAVFDDSSPSKLYDLVLHKQVTVIT